MLATIGGSSGYWTNGKGLECICKWAKLGLTESEIAGKIGVTLSTYRKWQRKYSDFADEIKKSLAIPELELEKSMFDLATGKTYIEEVKTTLDPSTGKIIKIEKVRKQVPPNPALQMFLAKNRIPEKYKVNSDDFEEW